MEQFVTYTTPITTRLVIFQIEHCCRVVELELHDYTHTITIVIQITG